MRIFDIENAFPINSDSWKSRLTHEAYFNWQFHGSR